MEFEKKQELEIHAALEYTQSIINTVHEPIIILFDNLKVALASRTFYSTFGVNPEETEDKYIYDLGNGQWKIPKLRELLEDILPKTTSFDDFEIAHDFPHIGKRIILLNARRIYMQANRTRLIIITMKDITDQKR